jgi:hypothetical protein
MPSTHRQGDDVEVDASGYEEHRTYGSRLRALRPASGFGVGVLLSSRDSDGVGDLGSGYVGLFSFLTCECCNPLLSGNGKASPVEKFEHH